MTATMIPRGRELIRQAVSGNLPPEYANLIQHPADHPPVALNDGMMK